MYTSHILSSLELARRRWKHVLHRDEVRVAPLPPQTWTDGENSHRRVSRFSGASLPNLVTDAASEAARHPLGIGETSPSVAVSTARKGKNLRPSEPRLGLVSVLASDHAMHHNLSLRYTEDEIVSASCNASISWARRRAADGARRREIV